MSPTTMNFASSTTPTTVISGPSLPPYLARWPSGLVLPGQSLAASDRLTIMARGASRRIGRRKVPPVREAEAERGDETVGRVARAGCDGAVGRAHETVHVQGCGLPYVSNGTGWVKPAAATPGIARTRASTLS